MYAFQTISLSKTYHHNRQTVTALQPVDLTVETGEFLAIVGPSGSGKSTLLHLAAGLDRPTTGRVCISGEDLYALSNNRRAIFRRRKIGFIFQFFNLIPVLTAEENVLLPLLLDDRKVDESFINSLFEMLGLSDRRHHQPDALSGGQQQRVAIARALANQPAVIFADEPTGNLDSATSTEVLHLLKESIRRYNQTLVMVTHDLEIASYADRIIQMKDGEILEPLGGIR